MSWPKMFREHFILKNALRNRLLGLAGICALVSPVKQSHADDPSFLSFGAGYYDILHDADAAEFRMEYRSKYRWWLFKPFAGMTATTNPAAFAYAGVLTDF